MDSDAALSGLLDRLVLGLRQVANYEKFVVACAIRRDESDDLSNPLTCEDDFSKEQFAAFYFYRAMGVYLDESGETQSVHDDSIDGDPDDEEAQVCAFATWLVKFELEELPELIEDGSLSSFADALMGVHHVGISVGGQEYVKTVDSTNSLIQELPDLMPLSDSEVNEILRKRRGFGLRS